MRVRWPLFVVLIGFAFSYAAYPYVTLCRLGLALRAGDAMGLQALVDWPSVREGIKEDICDLALDEPNEGTGLRPFGASFVRGIASSAIDRAVTAEALVAVAGAPAEPGIGTDVAVDWAFFAGPAAFDVSLRVPGQDDPVRLLLALRHGRWQVQRVWLPDALLRGANART